MLKKKATPKPRKKNLSIYFLHLKKECGDEKRGNLQTETFTKSQFAEIFNSIKKMSVNLKDIPSRYSDEEDPRCILFSDDKIVKDKNSHLYVQEFDGFITGVFFKRRNADFPYQSDEKNITQLNLPEGSAIAETTYFMINLEKQILVYLGNIHTGGYKKFAKYITGKYDEFYKSLDLNPSSGKSLLMIEKKPAKMGAFLIPNPDNFKDFIEKMNRVNEFEIKIAGSMKEMDELYNSQKGELNETVQKVLGIGKDFECASIFLKVTQEKPGELDKLKIANLREIAKVFFKEKNKTFIVKGEIDNETRFIDLIEEDFSYHTTVEFYDRYLDQRKIFDAMKKGYDMYIGKISENIK